MRLNAGKSGRKTNYRNDNNGARRKMGENCFRDRSGKFAQGGGRV